MQFCSFVIHRNRSVDSELENEKIRKKRTAGEKLPLFVCEEQKCLSIQNPTFIIKQKQSKRNEKGFTLSKEKKKDHEK